MSCRRVNSLAFVLFPFPFLTPVRLSCFHSHSWLLYVCRVPVPIPDSCTFAVFPFPFLTPVRLPCSRSRSWLLYVCRVPVPVPDSCALAVCPFPFLTPVRLPCSRSRSWPRVARVVCRPSGRRRRGERPPDVVAAQWRALPPGGPVPSGRSRRVPTPGQIPRDLPPAWSPSIPYDTRIVLDARC